MSEYDKLSEERKALQEQGLLPDWFTTGSWQVFKSKYLYGANPKEHYTRIAKTLASHTKEPNVWESKFFNLLWKGWLSPSTPVLSNTGTTRGLTISCAGNYIEDSIEGFYTSLTETAILSKNGFGTSSYLSDIRPRGSKISTGGKSLGVLPVLKMNIQTSIDVSQGGVRRGAWAGYLDIDHGDFWEVYHYLENNPDDCNIGWIIGDDFIERLNNNDSDAIERYQAVLKLKCMLGKGYFHFKDKVNRLKPESYKKHNLDIKASNLCVAPETLILTKEHGYKEISSLETQDVHIWNGEEWSLTTVRQTSDNSELIKVTFNDGNYIECTKEHKFYIVSETLLLSNPPKVQIIKVNAIDLEYGNTLEKFKDENGLKKIPFVVSVEITNRFDKTYCFTEPKRNRGMFNGVVTGNCDEIQLHSSKDYTFTCCLSSMNLAKYNEWKDKDAVFDATVFLDCIVSEFLDKAKNIRHLEKAVAFTEKGRAVGLGVMGLFSYFQQEMIDPESIDAHVANTKIFQHLDKESLRASRWLAKEYGEPEWCKGFGIRNSHRVALAPTKSTGAIMGGVSEGINPFISNIFVSSTASGDINRINPVLLDIMKKRGVYNPETITFIENDKGSVKNVDWLNDHEKKVFKTAFELDQLKLLKLASVRQRYIDQGQSLNLFILKRDEGTEEFVSMLHQYAFMDKFIKGLYYIYSDSVSKAESTSKILSQANKGECESCQ